mmetsp:Transcript_12296/g.15929  ORF Transcript_12296/g.15929 Transcript_12296/m.15929 type:complete len:204 (+) Transcript_12296:1499-2110(+)
MAVSTLSPVRTHTGILAAFNFFSVSGTPSWRRSSIPVTPNMVRSFSIKLATRASSSFLLGPTIAEASLCSLIQFANSSSGTILSATTNVLSPAFAKFCTCDFTTSILVYRGEHFPARERIASSAPLITNLMVSSSGSSYNIETLFLSLENGFTASSFQACTATFLGESLSSSHSSSLSSSRSIELYTLSLCIRIRSLKFLCSA